MREVSFSVSLTSCTNLVLYALTEKREHKRVFHNSTKSLGSFHRGPQKVGFWHFLFDSRCAFFASTISKWCDLSGLL